MTFNSLKLHYAPLKYKFFFLCLLLTFFKVVTFSADYYLNGKVNLLADFTLYTAFQGLVFASIWEVISWATFKPKKDETNQEAKSEAQKEVVKSTEKKGIFGKEKNKIIFLMTIAFGIRMAFIGFVLATNREIQLDIARTIGQEIVNIFWSIFYCWILTQFWIFFESPAKKLTKIIVAIVLAICIILPVGFVAWVITDSGYHKKNEKLIAENSAQIKFLDTHYDFLTSVNNSYFNNTTGGEQLVVGNKIYEGENLELCKTEECIEYDTTKTYKDESKEIQKLVEITPKESTVGSFTGSIFADGIYAFDNKYDPYGTLKAKNCQNPDVKLGANCLEYLDKYRDGKKLFLYTEK